MTSSPDIVLEALDICKSFPGVRALDKVSLTLRKGRLTALLGENGAGKSTLMNIVAGVFKQDSGDVKLAGETVSFNTPREAREAGISMIFQELNLVANLTVAENIYLSREPLNKLGFIDADKMNKDAADLLKQLDLAVEPTTPLSQLRVGQQQIVEIAKAISCKAKVLIMDEPTSAITEHEIEVLFGIINKLKQQGVAIAYITHKLEELVRIGDDAIVMRDGKLISSAPLKDLTRPEIVQMMVGREMKSIASRQSPELGPEVLRVEQLSLKHPQRVNDFVFKNVSFNVHSGEVLGIFGLMGAGRTELLESIFGLHHRQVAGQFFVNGQPVNITSPQDAIKLGLALAPEDRKSEGLVLGMSVQENASLACLAQFGKMGFTDLDAERQLADDIVARFRVKTPSVHQTIRNLSGGNQQKVILGKWLANKPLVLLLDEPTRGIDVNAKDEIYKLIHELAAEGLAVIVVSSELPEVQALTDRVIVLCEGRKTAEFSRTEATEESIMSAALPNGVEKS
ncbi:sugar ABC transporter ATP-binding protein [Paraglaciecola hydrolytica]|uniref:D-ribose transporter ATP-binding protein n=1 Tax=Paraglaciecola hydrolytica TaxID=1799789 RepID=A0A148KKD2_9ALTE|nr:sugar ABC transporter ATP-binding protein [Paraglaciecola hydrolytica]KXI26756.1 D-ribose transporter ATP-binding protein [Paraglaciecola hydrolytica]